MAQLAGIYCHDPVDAEVARRLWDEVQGALGSPSALCDIGPVSVGLFTQHAGERIVAAANATTLGFGGTSPEDDVASLVPPWLRCRYEPGSQRLVVATDRHGFALLYSRRIGGCTAFSTSARVLGRLSPAASPDPSALAEVLAFDHLLERRTMQSDVHAIPVGNDLVLTPGGAAFEVRHRYADVRLERSSLEHAVRDVVSRLRSAMSRVVAQSKAEPILLPLSGGLDSRLLAALAKDARGRVETFTFGSGDDGPRAVPDVAIGRRVAGRLELPWRFVELEDDWLEGSAERAIGLTDGQLDLSHSAGISVTRRFGSGSLRLDGIGGDALLGGAFLRRATFLSATRGARLEHLWRRYFRLHHEPWRSVVLPAAAAELERRARESLGASLDAATEGIANDDPRWFDFWVLRNRTRRFINNGPLLWNGCARSVYVFFDPALVDLLLSMHPTLRQGGRLQRQVFNAAWPELADIPWQKSGRALRRPGWLRGVVHALTPRAYPGGRPFFVWSTALQRSPKLQHFLSACLLPARDGVDRFGCFDRGAVESLLAHAIAGRRNAVQPLLSLASLVLSDRHGSSLLARGGGGPLPSRECHTDALPPDGRLTSRQATCHGQSQRLSQRRPE